MAVMLSLASIQSYERTKLTEVNRDHRQTESVMNDVEDVWWCRTPKNSVVYESDERCIRGQRRIALHCLLSFFYFSRKFRTETIKKIKLKNFEIKEKENFIRRKKKN
jgi:hypothetical protein